MLETGLRGKMIAEAGAGTASYYHPSSQGLPEAFPVVRLELTRASGGDKFRTLRRFTGATTHRRALLTILGMAA
jgi:hypothetical protein